MIYSVLTFSIIMASKAKTTYVVDGKESPVFFIFFRFLCDRHAFQRQICANCKRNAIMAPSNRDLYTS